MTGGNLQTILSHQSQKHVEEVIVDYFDGSDIFSLGEDEIGRDDEYIPTSYEYVLECRMGYDLEDSEILKIIKVLLMANVW